MSHFIMETCNGLQAMLLVAQEVLADHLLPWVSIKETMWTMFKSDVLVIPDLPMTDQEVPLMVLIIWTINVSHLTFPMLSISHLL